MPRLPRQKSKSGIYHIMLRGTNKQEIFHDNEDRLKFLDILSRYKKKTKMEFYAWCLMNNHVHLLVKEGEEELGVTMKRIGVSYTWYYSLKYQTVGHLFQDRYRSENVEDNAYFVTVTRYIHQNPVKAGIVKSPSVWEWSSCSLYYGMDTYPADLLDRDILLGMFSEDRIIAIEKFKEINELDNEDICMDNNVYIRLTDEEAVAEIKKMLPDVKLAAIKSLPKSQRDEIMKKAKEIEGVSQRQIARILGISQSSISIA